MLPTTLFVLAHCMECSTKVEMFPCILLNSCILMSARILQLSPAFYLLGKHLSLPGWRVRVLEQKIRWWCGECGKAVRGNGLLSFAL